MTHWEPSCSQSWDIPKPHKTKPDRFHPYRLRVDGVSLSLYLCLSSTLFLAISFDLPDLTISLSLTSLSPISPPAYTLSLLLPELAVRLTYPSDFSTSYLYGLLLMV